MKSVLISIQPYWVFLIIAQKMGWNIGKVKTVEVRKTKPKAERWDRVAKIYCSKDKKSFSKIPEEYQPLMKQFIGKVIGEFVCKKIEKDDLYHLKMYGDYWEEAACLTRVQLIEYGGLDRLYFWHISDLVIYDKPRELGEFEKPHDYIGESYRKRNSLFKGITRPPQSWCFVESEG